jgi:hypothetical protein
MVDKMQLRQWIAEKKTIDQVKEHLLSSGYEETHIADHVKAFVKAKLEQRQFTGFIVLGIGAFLGFISCLLSLTNPIPELYYWILYGLTSVAILIICVGLYWVFE